MLKKPGIKNFRDPKVSRNEVTHRWVMTLAARNRITFYSCPNLQDGARESEFGAHGGVWAYPERFLLTLNGQPYCVLIVTAKPLAQQPYPISYSLLF